MKMIVACLVWSLLQTYMNMPLRAQEHLEKIEINALNIAKRYELFLDVPMILNHPRRFSDTVSNADFLRAIADRLYRLGERRIVTPIGHPTIVCFVYWRGEEGRDTLVFGKGSVWYRGECHDLDPVLLWLMSVKLPQEYLQGVVEEIMTSERLQRIQQKKQE